MLGNSKPGALVQVERATWRVVLRMASGSSAVIEIYALLREWQVMIDAWKKDGTATLDLSFFDIRTFFRL
jgi:hypothetical protein